MQWTQMGLPVDRARAAGGRRDGCRDGHCEVAHAAADGLDGPASELLFRRSTRWAKG
jgi:hypothetical protein